MELRRAGLGTASGGGVYPLRGVKDYNIVPADYVADSGLYKVTVTHSLDTSFFIYQVYEKGQNSDIWPEKARRTTTILELWFAFNDKNLTAIIL